MQSVDAEPLAKHLIGALFGPGPVQDASRRQEFEWTVRRGLEELPAVDALLLVDEEAVVHWLSGAVLFTAEVSVAPEGESSEVVLDVRSRPLDVGAVRCSARLAMLGTFSDRPGLRTTWLFFDDELTIEGTVIIGKVDEDPSEQDAPEQFARLLAARLGWPDEPQP